MKHDILIEWDCKSPDHIRRHNVYPKELENAVNGRILIRNTSRDGAKLKEVIGRVSWKDFVHCFEVVWAQISSCYRKGCDNGREEIIYEKREVMYGMRRVKIESMEDMESLPEGEWVEAPVGLHAKFVYSVDRENNKLTIALPDEVAKRIGDRLCATFDGGEIVISELLE